MTGCPELFGTGELVLRRLNRQSYIRYSPQIAPLGYRTEDPEWRKHIKPGDLLDLYDTEGSWLLGTALDVKKEGECVVEVRVGYRVYCEDGSKADVSGRKFEGWREGYDERLLSYSLRVQRYYW